MKQRLTILLETTKWPVMFLKMDWQPFRGPWMRPSGIFHEPTTTHHAVVLLETFDNTFRLFWIAMGLVYAYPPFSLLAKVVTKIAYEGGRVVWCTPDWGCSGEHAYWRRLLDQMTVGRVQLPDGPIYVPEDSDTAMQAPEWASFLSIVDGSLSPVTLCDLDQVLLKEVTAENRGLTLFDLKKRSSEHLSATLTGFDPLMAIWNLLL